MKQYLLDTNIILDDAHNMFALGQDGENILIIPETVLDELDNKKKGWEDINYQARDFHRILEDAEVIGEETRKLKKGYGTIQVVKVRVAGIEIHLVSKNSYSTPDGQTNSNDLKILEVAKAFPEAIVVSNDIAFRIRARSKKLVVQPFKKTRAEGVNKLSFIEEIPFKLEDKGLIEGASAETFGVSLSNFTNVAFVCEETGEQVLAFYKGGKFHILDEAALRKMPVKPKNREQLFFLNMLIDPDVSIIVCAGVSGGGKNLLSLQGALRYQELNKDTPIRYCRNTVTAGDKEAQVGFLKGDEKAKLGVFMYPLIDAVDGYLRIEAESAMKNKKPIPVRDTNVFMEDHDIDSININQMRGSNLHGFLVFDEWQNSSNAVNKLMLTRVMEGSKVVILGDLNQVDHPTLSKFQNGLATMLKLAKTNDMVAGITLSKVQRGKIAAFADSTL